MLIKSYLVFPHKGKKEELKNQLDELAWCEVIPAENKDLLVIVTESISKEDEDSKLEALNKLTYLDHYSLVSGFNEKINN